MLPKSGAQSLPVMSIERVRGSVLQERRRNYRAYNPWCVECAQQRVQRTWDELDHRVPLWQGGEDNESNLQGLCYEHHALKTAREATQRAGSIDATS